MITEEQFTEALERAVEMRGADYVYPTADFIADNPEFREWRNNTGSCKYQVGGEPACLIGLALYLIDPELLPAEDFGDAAYGAFQDLIEDDVCIAAEAAQMWQDAGETWGEALEEYKRSLA